MFLQIHTLVSYPASLLNRDDAGLAKRIPFGNATRLRISSQCLKRHWRDSLQENLPDIPDGLRTRHFFTRVVLPRVVAAGIPEDSARRLIETLANTVITGGMKELDMSQPVLFGAREADYLVRLIQDAVAAQPDNPLEALKKRLSDKSEKENLKAMSKSATGLTGALFGRFVTSDLLARVDAPVHVAHAMTVHAANTEMDYFTVVDDLSSDEETGAAHANQAELGAGVFYGYVVVDLPLFISNLTGCNRTEWKNQETQLPKRVLESLIHIIASKSPGAKLGSTAPYSRAETVLLEVGREQPRTLANAFLEAIPMKNHLVRQATACMRDYLNRMDGMYGRTSDVRTLATIHETVDFGISPSSLDEAIQSALEAIWS
ncbi:type I-E CRISPR-associated protein Cas7/Cse4/CasC [Desulfatirhabdium butyrativorans]|uniref:type I-E CRISPR-associated protein Cas7/Cse4/CasC n=1 Tax=Desulfatirhabdium butyrativorans TaxID=340467 RepID=UPI00040ECC3E|nr:type I-E CRISPR-associated protein Cas7/Cse4/CasC [Desulfatirhabdium butyrativorans]